MKKQFLCIALAIFGLTTTYAQKGIFELGSIVQQKFTDTLNVAVEEGGIIVDVKINEKDYKLFLDTGAPTVLNSELTKNLEVLGETEITDAGNASENSTFKNLPSLKIGHLEYKDIAVMDYNIDILKTMNVDGILGANIMAKAVWDFDLKNNRIIVSDKVDKSLVNIATKHKVQVISTGSPVMTVDHSNMLEEDIFVDFGYNGFYSLSNNIYQVMKENDLVAQSITGRGALFSTAFSSTDSTFTKTVINTKIGKLKRFKHIAEVDFDEESSIGSAFLNYYRTIIDFKKAHIYFIPYGNELDSTFKSYGIEINFDPSDVFVSFVWDASKAYKKGIKTQDKILSINNVTVSEATKTEIAKIKASIKKGEDIILEINEKGNFITLKEEVLLAFTP